MLVDFDIGNIGPQAKQCPPDPNATVFCCDMLVSPFGGFTSSRGVRSLVNIEQAGSLGCTTQHWSNPWSPKISFVVGLDKTGDLYTEIDSELAPHPDGAMSSRSQDMR